MAPSRKQGLGVESVAPDGAQLGHGPPGACDDEGLAVQHPIDDLASVVAQIPDRHVGHDINVSHVRHWTSGAPELQVRLAQAAQLVEADSEHLDLA